MLIPVKAVLGVCCSYKQHNHINSDLVLRSLALPTMDINWLKKLNWIVFPLGVPRSHLCLFSVLIMNSYPNLSETLILLGNSFIF